MNKILVLILMSIILSKTNAQQKITYKFINLDSTNINELYELNKLKTGYLTKYKIDTLFSGGGLNRYKWDMTIHVSKSFTGYFDNGKKQGLFYMYPYNYCYQQYAKYYYVLDYNKDSITNFVMVFDAQNDALIFKINQVNQTDYWSVDGEVIFPTWRIQSLFFPELNDGVYIPVFSKSYPFNPDKYYLKSCR